MTLVPVREPAASMADLQAWMKQHTPVICHFLATPRNAQEQQTNTQNYTALVSLLTSKNVVSVFPLEMS